MPKENPKVSVIIPTYNRAHLVGRAIQSVLNQTYQDFEIIVVDDGSADNTKEVIKKFQEQDKRVKYIRHEKNRGGSAARNTGIKASRGEYIAFLDSDDKWVPGKLEKQLKKINDSELKPGAVYTGLKYVDIQRRNIRVKKPKYRGNIFQTLLVMNVVGTASSVLVKKECLNIVGLFDESLPSRQDLDMWIRISKKFNFDFILEPLTFVTEHEDRITENLEAKVKGYEILLEKIYDELKEDRSELAKYYYDLGIIYLKLGHLKFCRKYLMKAVINYPLIKAMIVLGLTMIGQRGYKFATIIRCKLQKFLAIK